MENEYSQEGKKTIVPKLKGGFKVTIPEDILVEIDDEKGQHLVLRLNKSQQLQLRKMLETKLGK